MEFIKNKFSKEGMLAAFAFGIFIFSEAIIEGTLGLFGA